MILHETITDLQHEQDFADKLSFIWGVELVKLPKLYRVDFATIMQSGKVSGFIEYKARTFNSDKYRTALLSLDKWLYLNVLSVNTKLPVFLFVGYTDVDTFIQINESIKIELSIRDGKPVVLINIEQFERI